MAFSVLREVGLAANNPAYQPWKPNCQARKKIDSCFSSIFSPEKTCYSRPTKIPQKNTISNFCESF